MQAGKSTASRRRSYSTPPPASRDPRDRRSRFHEKGYEATSIQDIADAVGILKGSLYYYITSKEDLLFEILEDVHQQGIREPRS